MTMNVGSTSDKQLWENVDKLHADVKAGKTTWLDIYARQEKEISRLRVMRQRDTNLRMLEYIEREQNLCILVAAAEEKKKEEEEKNGNS